MPEITLLYAGLLGIMSIILSAGAGVLRGKTGVSIGDGNNPELLLAMRRRGNFVEFVPFAIILLGLLEMNGVGALSIHIIGVVLILARICHALGLKAETVANPLRGIGAGATALATVIMSVWAIVLFIT